MAPGRPVSSFVLTNARGRVPAPPNPAPEPPPAPELPEPPPTLAALHKRDSRARQQGEEPVVPTPETAPDAIPEDVITTSDDLAAVVVRRTLKGMASGAIKPSLRDGLIAQQLLDRREEKAQDRQFMLSLAQALAGGGYSPPNQLLPATATPPDDEIEGYFEEIPLAPDHMRSE